MNRSKEVACFGLILAALMASLLMPVHGSGDEFNAQTRTLQFLSDVVMLDLSRYEVKLGYDRVKIDSHLGGAPREEVLYNISSSDSYCIASCKYINGVYSHCLIGWNKGSPIYTQPQPTNPVDFAKAVLERFQAFIGSPRYQPLIDMLDVINQTGTTTVVSGNFKLTETVNSARVGFRWVYSVSGFETKAMKITLLNGALYGIGDAMGLFKLSDAPAVVSEQQAISIALNSTVGFSWRASGQEYNVTDPIPTDLARTQQILNTRPPRDPYTLYPLWKVTLWLGKTYPGGVNHISVSVWADTGEVSHIKALGTSGGPPSEDPSASSPSTTSPSQSAPSTPSYSRSNNATSASDSAQPPDSAPSLIQPPEDASTTTDTSAPPAETSGPAPSPLPVLATTATVIAATAVAGTLLYLKKKRR